VEARELLEMPLRELCAEARALRRGSLVTFSPKVFIPLTTLCRDVCGYCTFARPPRRGQRAYMTLDEVLAIARAGAAAGCHEALFTLGDKPELRYRVARDELRTLGCDSTLEYLARAARLVLDETGLLPHLNPGLMTRDDLVELRAVSASMGIMLETASARLSQRGGPHYASPDKLPERRLATIAAAGEAQVPFTTGILIGIGETRVERLEALLAIRELGERYGHVQEVIVQNFRAKPGTRMADHREPSLEEHLWTIAAARVVLGPSWNVQAPPNLAYDDFPRLLDAGINDWGGVSPLTPDHVNPEAPWPRLDALRARTAESGLQLRERLCIYPGYALRPDPWIAGKMQRPVAELAEDDGLPHEGSSPRPLPWQDPDVQWKPRTIPLTFSKSEGKGLRLDASDVYGDVDTLEVDATREWAARSVDRSRIASEVRAGLRRAERHQPISDDHALALFQAEGPELEAVCLVADDLRRQAVGDEVTFVINRNINFTNVCYTGCRFCAFAQREVDAESYTLTLDEVADRAQEAWDYGATEVCMQGGLHPGLPGDFYFRLLDAVKARVPGIHVHAFSPMEILNGSARLGISFREFLEEARGRGLGSIPGTAAEILDDDVRWVLTKGKLPADTWEDIVTTAHRLGIPSSSTIMYGHVDAPPHWVAHIRRLAHIQDDTGGFTEFVPLPFVHQNAPIYLAGKARPGSTHEEDRRMHAVARILLDGRIPNIQVSWVKLGMEASKVMLRGGANDLGGTLMEETISRMAGAGWGIRKEPHELVDAIESIGRTAAQRTTTYGRAQEAAAR
jgi:FO synthase